MKKILILGATGTFGTRLTEALLSDTDYRLTLFSRHATAQYSDSDRVTVVDGDATSEADLQKVLKGQDVVYCAVSGEQLPQVAKALVAQMPKEQVEHLLFMGAVGIYNEIPEELDGDDNLDKEPAQIPNRKAVDVIEASALRYTILRPGYLREGAETDFVLTKKGEPAKGYITTIPSLIAFVKQLLADDTLYIGESIGITKEMQ